MGYICDGFITPKHWLQVADYTIIVTDLESDNQHLANTFTKWLWWVCLIIRVDKTSTFSIKKVRIDSTKYEPSLEIANEWISLTEMNRVLHTYIF